MKHGAGRQFHKNFFDLLDFYFTPNNPRCITEKGTRSEPFSFSMTLKDLTPAE